MGRRKRRLDLWPTSAAFQRRQQRCFFAADIGARASVNDHVQVVSRAENILADVTGLNGFINGLLEPAGTESELTADIDESGMRLNGVGRDERPFDGRVRIFLNEQTIFDRAGLALVRITNEIFRLRAVLRNKAPLHAGRKAGAAPAAQTRSFDLVDQLLRCHALDDLAPRTIAAARFVGRQRMGIRHVDIAQQNLFHVVREKIAYFSDSRISVTLASVRFS